MASLARRLAPAAALGGVAVALVAVLDPALAGADQPGPAQAGQAGGPADVSPAEQAGDPCASATQVTGPASPTPWGPVQVAALVADGRLCDVQAIAYPANDRKSERINASAIPMLNATAAQQGVAFDNISGATYTCEAYRDSLQQLLDSL